MKLAIIVSHPIQYYSPWFRHIAAAMRRTGEAGGQRTEDRGQRTEVGGRRSEDRGRRTEVGGRRSEDRGRRTEVRGQRSEDGGQRTEVGGRSRAERTADSPKADRLEPCDSRAEESPGGEIKSDSEDLNPLHATSNSQQNALRVFYLWDFGVAEKTDRGFGKAVKWDVDLLSGYDYEFVPNISKQPGTDWFGGLDNPELLQRVKAFRPDAVLQFGYNYKSLVGFDLKWNTKHAPLLFRGDSHLLEEAGEQSSQLPVFSRQREKLKRWVRQLGLRLLFKRFACFLSVGRANADYFRAHGVPDDKIVFCPHVVDNVFFLEGKNASVQHSVGSGQTKREGRGLREELGIAEDELVFLFAGKLTEKKQPLQLLEAFLAADIERATLLFVGSGELENALKERVFESRQSSVVSRQQEMGVDEKTKRLKDQGTKSRVFETARGTAEGKPQGDGTRTESCKLNTANSRGNVRFLAFQNQSAMPEVYRTGDVLVLPSRGRYETWGLAVNEAACCGLPAIVSSHVGCGPDLIEDGITGWIFEAGDVAALQRALEAAAASRTQLPQMGDNLRRLVVSEFSYERATSVFLEAAGRVLPGGRTCASVCLQ